MTELSLATSEARDVLAAVVARISHDAGLDVLLIKGPSLAVHGLRSERAWGDVDVLVRPEHVSRLRRELASSGWEPFNETPDFPLITLPHAITFVHPRWHTEIDVHTFLPGSYAVAATTFETLWRDRTPIDLAHQPVMCTGRIGSALVAALNLARTPYSPRTRDETMQWRAAVSAWPMPDRSALATMAAECRAADALAPLFDDANVPPTGRGALAEHEWDDWRLRVRREASDGQMWFTSIRRAPLMRKPAIAIRALTYDPSAMAQGVPQPTGWARVRHVLRRLRLAVSLVIRRKA